MSGSRRHGWLVVVMFVATAIMLRGAAQQTSAQSGFLLSFSGMVESQGTPPVPDGTVVTIVTARTPTDVTICGYGTISSGDSYNGSFSAEIPADVGPDCDYRTWQTAGGFGGFSDDCSAAHRYVFLVNGVKVGSDCPLIELAVLSGFPALAGPPAAGQSIDDLDLIVQDVLPNLPPLPAPTGVTLPAQRIFGTVNLTSDASSDGTPAPRGTRLIAYCDDCTPVAAGSAQAQLTYQWARQSDGKPICGSATVFDDAGHFSLDIEPVPACATKPGCPASASLEAHAPAEGAAATCVFHADVLLEDSISSSEFDPDQTFNLGFCYAISSDYWGESDGPVVLNFEPVAEAQPDGGGSPIRAGLVDLGDPVTGQKLDPSVFVPPDDAPQLPCGDTPEQYFRVAKAGQDVCNLPPVSISVTPGSAMAHRVTDCFSWYGRYAQKSPIVQEIYSYFNQQHQSALGIPQYVKVTENNWLILEGAGGETRNSPAGPDVQMLSPGVMALQDDVSPGRPIVLDLWCSVFFHELAHAYGNMAGVGARNDAPCSLGGGVKLDQRELFAMAAQNSYMIAKGQQPLSKYGSNDLPDSIQHPTADVWARLKQGLCP